MSGDERAATDPIPPEVRAEIDARLRAVAQEEGVRILLAVESGSRAWGFPSPDSDYDVRFVYVRPSAWYLSVDLEEQRDVIERPITDEIDLTGWDVRKALRLFGQSNPAFVEWIHSPIVYSTAGCFHGEAVRLVSSVYVPEKGIHHFRSMAKTNYRGYLRAESVRLKKYLYVLRPLLSVRWLERFGTTAPIQFDRLLDLVADQPELRAAIDALLDAKKRALEIESAPPVPVLNDFIERELERLESAAPSPPRQLCELAVLNDLFRRILQEPFGAA